MADVPAAPAERIYAGRQGDYLNDGRQLVKHGMRNIAVVLHDGRFYAFDNACYHHGGALLRGDIEDMGGHPCIVCPWHSYRITMDTGEGLYLGIEVDPTNPGGKPRQAVKSKGQKQRVYPVTVEADGAVYVVFDASGPKVESDTYATMAIANQEEATATPVGGGGGGVGRGPRLHSKSLGMELRSGHVFQAMSAGANKGGTSAPTPAVALTFAGEASPGTAVGGVRRGGLPIVAPSHRVPGNGHGGTEEGRRQRGEVEAKSIGGTARSVMVVSCTLIEEVCTDVKQFSFDAQGGAVQRRCELGEYVELELPINDAYGQPLRRKWTVSAVGHRNTLFTAIVKKGGADASTSGSAWLHQHALHRPLPLCRVGGTFTMVHHAQRIRHLHGRVLWLTAGIGITSAYANVVSTLAGGCAAAHSTTDDPLHVLHVHVDRHADTVAKLNELVGVTLQLSSPTDAQASNEEEVTPKAVGNNNNNNKGAAALLASGRPATGKSYTLRLFLTKAAQQAGKVEPLPDLVATGLSRSPNAVTLGRRYGYQDIADAVGEVFPMAGSGFLAFVCGPPSFIDMCSSALLSLGVPESDILTDDP